MITYPEIHRPPSPPANDVPVVLLHGGTAGNWMWEPQVSALGDRTVVTPDLPGLGTRVGEDWPGLATAADEMASRILDLGVTPPFDLAGLSLGGIVAVNLTARHPELVRSLFETGAILDRVGVGVRASQRIQLTFWEMPRFWKVQAALLGIPEDGRDDYIEHGLSVRRETVLRQVRELQDGAVPAGLADYDGPILALAGERERGVFRRSLHAIKRVAPQAEIRLAPRMHHIWSVEGEALFNATLRGWLDGRIDPRLLPV